MWTQKFCLICIYILRNYAFQISNEALFLAFLQPVANRLKSFILPSNRMGKTSSASTFNRTTSLDIILLASDRNYYTMSIFLSHPPVLTDYLLSSVSKTQKIYS